MAQQSIFDTTHLEVDWQAYDLEDVVESGTLPDLCVDLEINLLAPGDGIVTDRHHASADRYEADDPMNQIGGQISPFTLSGWLRHGSERWPTEGLRTRLAGPDWPTTANQTGEIQ